MHVSLCVNVVCKERVMVCVSVRMCAFVCCVSVIGILCVNISVFK